MLQNKPEELEIDITTLPPALHLLAPSGWQMMRREHQADYVFDRRQLF